jgi:IS66 Orf2 like protein
MSPIELITRGERRRRWTVEQKQTIAAAWRFGDGGGAPARHRHRSTVQLAEGLAGGAADCGVGGACGLCPCCGGLVKLLWFDGQGMCLFSKRLERGHFVWPATNTGRVSLSPAQVSMLLEGIDWRMPQRVHRPELAG